MRRTGFSTALGPIRFRREHQPHRVAHDPSPSLESRDLLAPPSPAESPLPSGRVTRRTLPAGAAATADVPDPMVARRRHQLAIGAPLGCLVWEWGRSPCRGRCCQQPGDERVGVPHVTGPLLVTSPGPRRESWGELEDPRGVMPVVGDTAAVGAAAALARIRPRGTVVSFDMTHLRGIDQHRGTGSRLRHLDLVPPSWGGAKANGRRRVSKDPLGRPAIRTVGSRSPRSPHDRVLGETGEPAFVPRRRPTEPVDGQEVLLG